MNMIRGEDNVIRVVISRNNLPFLGASRGGGACGPAMSALPVEDVYMLIAWYLHSQGVDLVTRPLLEQLTLPSEPHWSGSSVPLTFEQLRAKYSRLPTDLLVRVLRSDPRLAAVPGSALAHWQAHGGVLDAPSVPVARPLPGPSTVGLAAGLLRGDEGSARRERRRLASRVLVAERVLQLAWSTRGHTHNVFNALYHAVDGAIITGADDGLVKVWSEQGALQATARGGRSEVTDMILSPGDGAFIVASFHDAADGAALWSYPSCVRLCEWRLDLPVIGLAFLRVRGRLALALATERELRVCWSRADDMCSEWVAFCTIPFHERNERVSGLASGPDGMLVVQLAAAFSVLDFSAGLEPRMCLQRLPCGGDASVVFLETDAAGRVATAIADTLCLYGARGSSGVAECRDFELGSAGAISSLRWSARGSYVLLAISSSSATDVSTIYVVDSRTLDVVYEHETHRALCFVLQPHPQFEHVFFSAAYDGSVQVCALAIGDSPSVTKRVAVEGAVFAGAWSPDGCALALTTSAGVVSVFGVVSGARVADSAAVVCGAGSLPVPLEQWFATDYDPVVLHPQLGLMDLRTNVPLAQCLPGALVNYRGVSYAELRSVGDDSVAPLAHHLSPSDFHRSLNQDVAPLPHAAVARAPAQRDDDSDSNDGDSGGGGGSDEVDDEVFSSDGSGSGGDDDDDDDDDEDDFEDDGGRAVRPTRRGRLQRHAAAHGTRRMTRVMTRQRSRSVAGDVAATQSPASSQSQSSQRPRRAAAVAAANHLHSAAEDDCGELDDGYEFVNFDDDDDDDDGGGGGVGVRPAKRSRLQPRRLAAVAAAASMAEDSDDAADVHVDDDVFSGDASLGPPLRCGDAGGPRKLALPSWMTVFAPSAQRSVYVPQVGDAVTVFFDGLLSYYEIFCPTAERPDREAVDGRAFAVASCAYGRHEHSADAYCELELVVATESDSRDDERQRVVVRFHPCEGVSDFVVPTEDVNASRARLHVGATVQSFFVDVQTWYAARVVEFRSQLWQSVGVRWLSADDDGTGELDWLNAWELFPVSDPLGQLAASLLPSLERATRLRVHWVLLCAIRDFFNGHPTLATNLRPFHFEQSPRFQRGELVYAMQLPLVLRRLRHGYYRRREGLLHDLAHAQAFLRFRAGLNQQFHPELFHQLSAIVTSDGGGAVGDNGDLPAEATAVFEVRRGWQRRGVCSSYRVSKQSADDPPLCEPALLLLVPRRRPEADTTPDPAVPSPPPVPAQERTKDQRLPLLRIRMPAAYGGASESRSASTARATRSRKRDAEFDYGDGDDDDDDDGNGEDDNDGEGSPRRRRAPPPARARQRRTRSSARLRHPYDAEPDDEPEVQRRPQRAAAAKAVKRFGSERNE